MFGQHEAGVTTGLEEVFLSQEFGQAGVRRVTLGHRAEQVVEIPQLEQVFMSEQFGRPRAVPALVPQTVEAAVMTPAPENTTITVVQSPRTDYNRHRVIGAVAGVAVAAAVSGGVGSVGETISRFARTPHSTTA